MPMRSIYAFLFASLTTLATIVFAMSLSQYANLESWRGISIGIWLVCFWIILRAANPRLALARGLMIFALGLFSFPVQLFTLFGLHLFDVASNPEQGIGDASVLNWISAIPYASAIGSVALAAAPVIFVFGWAYATPGPEDRD